jgi:hypothetical protein
LLGIEHVISDSAHCTEVYVHGVWLEGRVVWWSGGVSPPAMQVVRGAVGQRRRATYRVRRRAWQMTDVPDMMGVAS